MTHPDPMSRAIAMLRRRNEPVPIPMRLPDRAEVEAMERALNVSFPPDYRRFLLEASDVVFGALEPATLSDPDAHTHLPKVLASAREYGLPESLLPICEDNADFYCLDAEGGVTFWSHEGWTNERWPSLAQWIFEVWVGMSDV